MRSLHPEASLGFFLFVCLFVCFSCFKSSATEQQWKDSFPNWKWKEKSFSCLSFCLLTWRRRGKLAPSRPQTETFGLVDMWWRPVDAHLNSDRGRELHMIRRNNHSLRTKAKRRQLHLLTCGHMLLMWICLGSVWRCRFKVSHVELGSFSLFSDFFRLINSVSFK